MLADWLPRFGTLRDVIIDDIGGHTIVSQDFLLGSTRARGVFLALPISRRRIERG